MPRLVCRMVTIHRKLLRYPCGHVRSEASIRGSNNPVMFNVANAWRGGKSDGGAM